VLANLFGKISSQIMLSILGCSILTAGLVGGFSLYEGRNYIRTEAVEKLVRTAEAHAHQISGIIESTESYVAALQGFVLSSIDIDAFLNDPAYMETYEKELDRYARQLSRRTQHAIGLYITFHPDLTSRIYEVWYADMTNHGILQRVTSELYSQYMVIEENWIYPEPSLFTPDQEGMEYLYETMERGIPIWFDPYVELGLDITALSYVEPLIVQGHTIGVVGMDIDIDNIKRMILEMQVYNRGYAFLLNLDREVVIHPFEDEALPFQDLHLAGRERLEDLLELSASGVLESEDRKNLLSYATLSNGWILVLVPPYQEIMRPIVGLSGMIIVLTLTAIFIAVLAAYHLSHRFSGSMEAAARQLHYMELGDFTKEIPPDLLDRQDDLGHFIKSVHTMQQIIKSLVYQLEPEESLFRQTFLETRKATDRAAKAIGQLALEAENKEEDLRQTLAKLALLNETLHDQVVKEVEKNRQKDAAFIYHSRQAKMGEMLANIAHQWRQPLNNLNLSLSNLEDSFRSGDLTDEEFHQRLSRAEKIIMNLSQTIDDFQNYLKPSREIEHFSLKDHTAFALEIMEESLRSGKITVSWAPSEDLRVPGYPNEYVQVMTNLLSNARDALQEVPPVKRRILIEVRRQGQYARVRVENSGPPLSREVAEKVFTVHFTTKGRNRGTGIGLTMSRMILEEHFKGNLTFQNTPGGVVWIITLPLTAEEDP